MKPGGLIIIRPLIAERGFTIVETLIVLSVTGMLLFLALLAFAGQQNRVEFNQAVRDIQSVIQQTANELSAGFFPNSNDITCLAGASGPILGAGSQEQGTNTGCILLGRAMQFRVAGSNGEGYTVFTLAGLRDNNGDLASTKPKTVYPSPPLPASSIVNATLHNNLKVVRMTYTDGGAPINIGSFAFVNGLGSVTGGSFDSGTQQISVVPVGNSKLDDPVVTAAGDIDNNLDNPAQSPPNPRGGVQICFASGGSDQSGLVTVGGNGRTVSVTLDIKNSTDCT